MAGHELISDDFSMLMAALCDGAIDPEGFARLERRLETDPAARRWYIAYLDLHGELYWDHLGRDGGEWGGKIDGRGMRKDELLPVPTSAATDPSSFALFPSETPGHESRNPVAEPLFPSIIVDAPTTSRLPSSPLLPSLGVWLFSYGVATVIMGLVLLGGWAYKITHYQPQFAEGPSPSFTSSNRPELVFVGRITGTVECQWADPQTQTSAGAHVPINRKYALASGLMEITYDSGAKVILEGPCTYEVESRAGGFLSLGKLTARVGERGEGRGERVKPQAANLQISKSPNLQIANHSSLSTIHYPLFSVRTPTAVVTDLGTEFGVSVAENGDTVSHVFQGSIIVRVAGGPAASAPQGLTASAVSEAGIFLAAGESARVEKDAQTGDVRIATGEKAGVAPMIDRFVRMMPAESTGPILVDDPTLMVAQWNLAEGRGVVVYPAIGRVGGKIHGNVVWQKSGPPAVPNASLYFGGGQSGMESSAVGVDYIDFGWSSSLAPASITVGFWAKADPAVNYEGMAMVSKYCIAPGSYEIGWGNAENHGQLFWRIWLDNDERACQYARCENYSAHEFKDGEWHFIAATYDHATATSNLYVDGNLAAGTVGVYSAPAPLYASGHELNVGRRPYDGMPVPYKGYLGGPFFIRGNAMSAAEVKSYYKACLALDSARRAAERREGK